MEPAQSRRRVDTGGRARGGGAISCAVHRGPRLSHALSTVGSQDTWKGEPGRCPAGPGEAPRWGQRLWEGGTSASVRTRPGNRVPWRGGHDDGVHCGATTTVSGPGSPVFCAGRRIAQCRRARLFRWEGGPHSQKGSWALGSRQWRHGSVLTQPCPPRR